MSDIRLEPVRGSDAGLKLAPSNSGLPTEDLGDPGRSFFRAVSLDGGTVGYAGIETCGDAVPSQVVGHLALASGRGIWIVDQGNAEGHRWRFGGFPGYDDRRSVFEKLGFIADERGNVPTAVLSTRQLSGICPVSARIMKLNWPPT